MKSIFSRPNYRHRLTEQTIKEIKTNLAKKNMQTNAVVHPNKHHEGINDEIEMLENELLKIKMTGEQKDKLNQLIHIAKSHNNLLLYERLTNRDLINVNYELLNKQNDKKRNT